MIDLEDNSFIIFLLDQMLYIYVSPIERFIF